MVRRKRRGVIVVFAAVLLIVMVAMIAFAVDLGFITVARTELQSAADAAALAGAADLPKGEAAAKTMATDYVGRNISVANSPSITQTAGQWDFKEGKFSAGKTPLDALQLKLDTKNQSLFFGKVLGTNSFNAGATATAVVRPRDIVLVLDYSGSMNSGSKIQQLKSSVGLFFDVLDELGNQDKASFVRYSTNGTKEESLTTDFPKVKGKVNKYVAEGFTNIYEGMKLGREEFKSHGRKDATKMMVLMTDGLANRPTDRDPKQAVIDEAKAAHALGIDLYTISFGSDADHTLMDQVADIGGDVHFAVDGSVGENAKLLKEVFVKIANKRKVVLVQ